MVDGRAGVIATSPTTVVPNRFEATIMFPGKPHRVWLDIRTDPKTGPVIYEIRVQHSLTAPGGITTGLLHSLKLRELRRLALEEVTKEITTVLPAGYFRAPGDAPGVAHFGSVVRGPGRGRPMDDEHLRRVAVVYREAIAVGSRAPVEAVRKALHASRSTAGRWVVQARKAGILGPARGPIAGEAEDRGEGDTSPGKKRTP